MSTRTQDAIGRLSDRLQERDGRSVTYQQGATCTVSGITAVPTDETYKVFDKDGRFTQVQSMDWIFKASDLPNITPRTGDRITEIIGDTRYEYDVFPIDKLPCFEWLDNSRVMLLLHSKRTT